MEITLLGPVSVRVGDRLLDAGTPQQRHVLAVLATEARRPVTAEALIDRVWEDAPDGARRTLHVYLARLRRLLTDGGAVEEPVVLPRRWGGYVLDIPPDRVDLHRFRRLVERARAAPDADRIPLLRSAVGMWTGEPLAGLRGGWADGMREAWRRQYVDAVLVWADTELRAGAPDAVLGPLSELFGAHPLVEPLAAALMRALHAVGRTADALACYEELRGRLADELGADPSREVQEAYRAALRNTGGGWPGRRPSPPVPAQLPAAVPGFVARGDELRRLDELVRPAEQPAAVQIAVLSGAAGVGKTALAVHWAHRHRDRFPDGQLYANLRASDGSGAPVDSTEVLRLFLAAFGVTHDSLPADPAARAALYRTDGPG